MLGLTQSSKDLASNSSTNLISELKVSRSKSGRNLLHEFEDDTVSEGILYLLSYYYMVILYYYAVILFY